MKQYLPRLEKLISHGLEIEDKDSLKEMRVIYLNFTMFMAAVSSPVIGVLHLGQWFGYSSLIHGVNCLIFSGFMLWLMHYSRRSSDNFIVSRNLLLSSLFLIFTSNLVFSTSEDMRLLWFTIILIVAQGLGGAAVRNVVAVVTATLFAVYLLQPFVAVDLSASDIISSLLLLTLVVILFDHYDYTIHNTINQMAAAKAEALHMAGVKSRFLSSMSHEIRTPLNGITGFTEMLLREENDPHKIERLNYIRSSGSMLSRLIGNVLDLSKIDDGQMTIEKRCFELRKELEAISIFAVTAMDKGVAFSFHIAPEVPKQITGDSLRLNQVLCNLVNNGIKFTPSGGKVELNVTVSQEGKRLGFEVVDTGMGIPAGKRSLIFAPFTQLDESVVRQYGGTGLGLSISQQLVQLMGDELRLSSEEGKGSRFFFELPLEVCQTNRLLEAPSNGLPANKSRIKILVADDDRINQVLMRDFLERMGHQVTVVENGQEAVDTIAREHHDLVLMDIRMPVMDGVEATQQLRGMGVTVPIIALTANIFKEDVDAYLSSGMTQYISKPVDIAQLEQLIHTYCEVGE